MFRFEVGKAYIVPVETEPLVSGAQNIYECQFDFSSDWDGIDKTACFRAVGKPVPVALDQQGRCQIHPAALAMPGVNLSVGIYGTRNGEIVQPTVWCMLPKIQPGAYPGEEAEIPPVGIYDQVLAIANEAARTAQLVKETVLLSWTVIQQLVRQGNAPQWFSIGDQLVCNHREYGQLVWDIIGFDTDVPADSQYSHSMTLLLHDQLPGIRIQFDAAEPENPDSGRRTYGSNSWKESGIRQWLNSDGPEKEWWTAQTEYDVQPNYHKTMAGFLRGLDGDMLAVIGAVNKTTARNTVTDGGGTDETQDRVFLLSRTEVYGGMENDISEGSAYAYFEGGTELNAPGIEADANRSKTQDGTATYWLLRSAQTDNSYEYRAVRADGSVGVGKAKGTCGIAPACCII